MPGIDPRADRALNAKLCRKKRRRVEDVSLHTIWPSCCVGFHGDATPSDEFRQREATDFTGGRGDEFRRIPRVSPSVFMCLAALVPRDLRLAVG